MTLVGSAFTIDFEITAKTTGNADGSTDTDTSTQIITLRVFRSQMRRGRPIDDGGTASYTTPVLPSKTLTDITSN